MDKKTEALKLALEALEYISSHYMSLPKVGCMALAAIEEALAEQPEFFTHSVEQPYDWSEWVCPDPKSYLMKCCDCGLVHEAQFGVVRYKSETEREDCDMVDDPNLQAVFRMRRSEQWTPEDRAYRPGGLAQPERPAVQGEPVAWDNCRNEYQCRSWCGNSSCASHFENTTPQPAVPERKRSVKPLTDEMVVAAARMLSDRQAAACNVDCGDMWKMHGNDFIEDARAALEAAHGITGEQHG